MRFPADALIGNTVWVDPATGIAYGSNATGGYVETKWTVVTNVRPGSLGVISPYAVISLPRTVAPPSERLRRSRAVLPAFLMVSARSSWKPA